MSADGRAEESPQQGIQSIEIGAPVLRAPAAGGGPMALSEVAGNCAMYPAKVHRYLVSLVRAGDRDGATAPFQTEEFGLPAEMVEGMRQSDVWGYLTGLAHSLPYDYALFDAGSPVPAGRLAGVAVPVLAIAGSNTFPWLYQATEQVARAVPDGRFLSLTGHDHGVLHQPEALLPVLREFLG